MDASLNGTYDFAKLCIKKKFWIAAWRKFYEKKSKQLVVMIFY